MTGAPEDEPGITVVCTDRERHPRRRIAIGTRTLGPMPTQLTEDEGKRHPGWLRPDGELTFTIDCPTCGRHVEMRAENWRGLVDGLVAADVRSFDISKLPY